MLPRKHRLPKTKFKKVFKKGKRLHSPFLTVISLKEKDLEGPQIGIIVGTKVYKKATGRNKIKRQLREIIRENLDKIPPYFNIIFLTKPSIVNTTRVQRNKTVRKLISQLD